MPAWQVMPGKDIPPAFSFFVARSFALLTLFWEEESLVSARRVVPGKNFPHRWLLASSFSKNSLTANPPA